jgi:hypothetical protein
VTRRREPALWRKTFDALEQPVGRWLHVGVHHEDFHDALTVAKRLQRGAGRRVEGVSTTVLHLLNIPARRDVRRATAQLTRIERELRALTDSLEQQGASDQQADT